MAISLPSGQQLATDAAPLAVLRLPARVLVVASWFPPRAGGSSVVLSNLLRWFDPADYVVATVQPPDGESHERPAAGSRVVHISHGRPAGTKGQQLWNTCQIPAAVRKASAIARAEGCGAVLGVFPDLQLMTVAYLVHRRTGLPLAAYMHDFMIEAGYGSYLGAIARWLQPRVFRSARPLWLMSDGMVEHALSAYGTPGEALVHAYNDAIPTDPPSLDLSGRSLRLGFSGAVYDANAAPLARIVRALGASGHRLFISGHSSAADLERAGVSGPHVERVFLADRAQLPAFLGQHDVLMACLAWPDESWYGEHELATIFSTKVPEYLAQGRPLLVHCPDHYYLARFVRTHDCGWVVTERSEEAILTALNDIAANAAVRERRCRNALVAAQRFAGARVARQFADGIGLALAGSRGSAS